METAAFDAFPRGTLYALLADAYSAWPDLAAAHAMDWKDFDDFVYDHLSFMNACGFITLEGGAPIGFISWDPRLLPREVRVGHNCIAAAHKSRGKGKEQLGQGLKRIMDLGPAEIVVSTGAVPFFLPARKMYEALGFVEEGRKAHEDPLVPELVEYRLLPAGQE